MTIKQARQQLRYAQMGIKRAERDGIRKAVIAGRNQARKQSSGTASYAQLRKEDHPYATRHGMAKRDPAIINKHRGLFYVGWAYELGADGLSARIVNRSDAADFMGGTDKMLPRPIEQEVAAYTHQEAQRLISLTIQKALQKWQ